VEQHGRGGGGGNLGEAGHVVDGLRCDGGRGFVIGKAAQRVLEHNFTAGQHSEGAAGKGAGGDGLVQHAAGGGKTAVSQIGPVVDRLRPEVAKGGYGG
jgi:hypothetical protein